MNLEDFLDSYGGRVSSPRDEKRGATKVQSRNATKASAWAADPAKRLSEQALRNSSPQSMQAGMPRLAYRPYNAF